MTAGPRVWVEAARPRTLSAAVAPVLVGSGAAGRLILWRFVAALVVALALQVGVNYANDYFDGTRGVDRRDRVGPRRAVASGLVPPARMRLAMLAAFAVAGVAGLLLAAAAGWQLLAVGLVCVGAAVAYSGGPRPYASAGLGELFVFVFFGLVATVGTAYVLTERIVPAAVAAAVPIGLLITAILIANNARDIATDAAAGKRTLAVRMGRRRTGRLYVTLVASAFVALTLVALVAGSPGPLLALLTLPLAVGPARLLDSAAEAARLVPALVGTSRLVLVFGALLAAGLAGA
ncbi:MAG: 1,4-dihydroxy-2-naphthoate polyprenyltransferase [Egibacteraceae bacterium]